MINELMEVSMPYSISDLKRLNTKELYHKLIEKYGNEDNFTDTIITNVSADNVPYLTFKPFVNNPYIRQAFSTRLGGVSSGMYESMNLTFNPVGQYSADSYENVLANFKLMADTIDIPVENMVYTKQTHTTNIKIVDNYNKGMGIIKERDYDNIDGIITNTNNLCLVSSFADCIPVTLVDAKKGVIAALHSGWKGTVGNISQNGIECMKESFGCNEADIIAFVGPGICKNCYQVSEDVAIEFMKVYSAEETELILTPDDNNKCTGKYHLDLIAANYINLINAGLLPHNIYVADVCTSCNKELLFSHRASGGRRGIMCNFIYMRLI